MALRRGYLWEFQELTLAFPIRGVRNGGSIRQKKYQFGSQLLDSRAPVRDYPPGR